VISSYIKTMLGERRIVERAQKQPWRKQKAAREKERGTMRKLQQEKERVRTFQFFFRQRISVIKIKK
jgi:hypothetical protein